jgi:hypothetical protein
VNNSILQIKLKQRLNKLASNDFDNIESWQVVEAFNKAQSDWCRRNLHGINIVQEGDEQSTRRIDDFQILLQNLNIVLSKKNLYFETDPLPDDYFGWKRISINASNDCCEDRKMIVYLAEQGNVDELLRDYNKKPSFEWGETFATLKGNKVQIYTNNEFTVNTAELIYYRQPIKIQILNSVDPYTQVTSTVDVECEFKDDIVELILDETAKVLAGDIESFNQMQRAQQSVENNN